MTCFNLKSTLILLQPHWQRCTWGHKHTRTKVFAHKSLVESAVLKTLNKQGSCLSIQVMFEKRDLPTTHSQLEGCTHCQYFPFAVQGRRAGRGSSRGDKPLTNNHLYTSRCQGDESQRMASACARHWTGPLIGCAGAGPYGPWVRVCVLGHKERPMISLSVQLADLISTSPKNVHKFSSSLIKVHTDVVPWLIPSYTCAHFSFMASSERRLKTQSLTFPFLIT